MDRNDIETVMQCIVSYRDVQRLLIFLHAHEQALGKGLCPWALLDDVSLGQYPYGLRSGNAAFLCPEQRMVAPRNAPGPGCRSNNSNIKRHVSYNGYRVPQA
jgi:hypothetical protein